MKEDFLDFIETEFLADQEDLEEIFTYLVICTNTCECDHKKSEHDGDGDCTKCDCERFR